jgi:cell division protein FtsL
MRKKIGIKAVGIVIALLYAGGIFVGQRVSAYKLRQEIANQLTEFEKVKETNQRLQDEVNMSKDPRFIEKLARERLGLIKEGETPVIHSSGKK